MGGWSWVRVRRVWFGVEGSPLSRVVSPAEVERSMRSSLSWCLLSGTSSALSEYLRSCVEWISGSWSSRTACSASLGPLC